MSFGKRESIPVAAFQEITSRPARDFRPSSPLALEVPGIGTSRKIKAVLDYCAVIFGMLGTAIALLLIEHPFSSASTLINAAIQLFH